MNLSLAQLGILVVVALVLGAGTTIASYARAGLRDDMKLLDQLQLWWDSLGRRDRALIIVGLWFTQSVLVMSVAGATIGYFMGVEEIGIWPFTLCGSVLGVLAARPFRMLRVLRKAK